MNGHPLARALGPLLLATAAAAAPAGDAQAAWSRIQVRGRVVDEAGRGVAGMTVRVIMTSRAVELPKFSSGGKVSEAGRATTDANGFYEIDAPRDRTFDDYYLRFHDPATFDAVRWLPPPDRDITPDLRRGEWIQADVALGLRPDWPLVTGRLALFGEDSPRGRILRAMGIPEREGPGAGPDGPREEWWYYSRGVVYYFRDGRSAGFRRFEPVTASISAGVN